MSWNAILGERKSCFKCCFQKIAANLADIQTENLQNVEKCISGKMFQESMGYLIYLFNFARFPGKEAATA